MHQSRITRARPVRVGLTTFCLMAARCVTGPASFAQAQVLSGAASVDIYERGPDGHNINFRRIEQRDTDAVRALLDAGIDVNIRGLQGMTPAIWAASSGAWTHVVLFADRGADLCLASTTGMTVARIVDLVDRVGSVRAGSAEAQALEAVRARLIALELL
jgi:hypothetical protein